MPLDGEIAMRARTDDRLFDVHRATPFAGIPECDRLGPPHMVVTVTMTNDGMGQLMRHDLRRSLEAQRQYVHRDFDELRPVLTDAETRLGRVESEAPPDETVTLDLIVGELGHDALQGEMFHDRNIQRRRNKARFRYNRWPVT